MPVFPYHTHSYSGPLVPVVSGGRHTWAEAVALAIYAGQCYGCKQHVFKHAKYGWVWRDAAHPSVQLWHD